MEIEFRILDNNNAEALFCFSHAAAMTNETWCQSCMPRCIILHAGREYSSTKEPTAMKVIASSSQVKLRGKIEKR